jgi:hypothetical protein
VDIRATYLPLAMKRSIANQIMGSTPGFTGFAAAKLARKRTSTVIELARKR